MRIELQNVSKQYESEMPAVRNLNLSIENGELVTILGPSGCGKSTTLLMIAGIYPTSQGHILFDGQRVNDVQPKDRQIGMVFQNSALYPNMNVLHNIAFPLKNKRVPRSERTRLAQEAAERVEMGEYLKRKPHQLSGGQRQRVAIARAVVKNPGLLLLDEPLSSLDANLRGSMREEIRRLQKDLGITTIMVTHDQEEALSMSDKIAVMNRGELQQFGTPQELYAAPANWFVASFLGMPAMNELICDWAVPGYSLMIEKTGQVIPLYSGVDVRSGSDMAPGNMRLAFRPHQVKLIADADERLTSDLLGRVISVEFTGREKLVHVKIGDTVVKGYAPAAESFATGEEIGVRLLGGYYLFDRQTGENVMTRSPAYSTLHAGIGEMPLVYEFA